MGIMFLKVIKDYQLFIIVGILLVIDLAIMTTWQVVDPFYRETKQLKNYVSNEKKGFPCVIRLLVARDAERRWIPFDAMAFKIHDEQHLSVS